MKYSLNLELIDSPTGTVVVPGLVIRTQLFNYRDIS